MPGINVSLFSQFLGLIDRNSFAKLVAKHNTDKHCKGFNSWSHLVAMLFCHLAKAVSLREISNGLRSATGNLNHLGVDKAPSKSILSYQNKHRDWHLFCDFYHALLEQLEPSLSMRRKYAVRLKRRIFIMDSTVIPLCLKIFDWAKFRRRKGAIKLHTILDYDSTLPVFVHVTDGKKHDITVAKEVSFPPESVLVIDRAYVDYQWLAYLDSIKVFFVTRLKDNAQIEIVEEYLTNAKHEHIMQDADIRLSGFYPSQKYPKTLRIVKIHDDAYDRELIFLTNQMSWTADTISQLYKARWSIELFFKEIKQVLKIKTFIGTSYNAVMIQIWTAMIAILLLKYLRAKAEYPWHLSNLVGFLRINLFVKIDLWKWVNEPFIKNRPPPPQPTLF